MCSIDWCFSWTRYQQNAAFSSSVCVPATSLHDKHPVADCAPINSQRSWHSSLLQRILQKASTSQESSPLYRLALSRYKLSPVSRRTRSLINLLNFSREGYRTGVRPCWGPIHLLVLSPVSTRVSPDSKGKGHPRTYSRHVCVCVEGVWRC